MSTAHSEEGITIVNVLRPARHIDDGYQPSQGGAPYLDTSVARSTFRSVLKLLKDERLNPQIPRKFPKESLDGGVFDWEMMWADFTVHGFVERYREDFKALSKIFRVDSRGEIIKFLAERAQKDVGDGLKRLFDTNDDFTRFPWCCEILACCREEKEIALPSNYLIAVCLFMSF